MEHLKHSKQKEVLLLNSLVYFNKQVLREAKKKIFLNCSS
jgi:hypothetical protein